MAHTRSDYTNEYARLAAAQLSGLGGMGMAQNVEAERRRVAQKADATAKTLQRKYAEIREISSIPFTTGIVVAVVIGSFMLMFVYYDVLNRNKKRFGIMLAVLGVFLLIALGRGVREHGAGAIGDLSVGAVV